MVEAESVSIEEKLMITSIEQVQLNNKDLKWITIISLIRPLQVVFLFLVHRPHHEITINQCANCACALLSRYYLTFDLEICDQLQKQEGERRCKVAH